MSGEEAIEAAETVLRERKAMANLLGTDISASVQPLYLPGTVSIIVSMLTFGLHRMAIGSYRLAWADSARTMVAASAVVGLVGREGSVIRKTLPAFFYYALVPGALGYAIALSAAVGSFSAGTIILAFVIVGVVLFVRHQLSQP